MSTPFKDRKPPSNAEIREYFQILKEDGRSRVFAPLAEALIRRGRLDEAEQICRLGIEHNPDFSDGHLAMARVLFYRFRYQEAVSEVKLTLALDGKSIEAYLIAAEIFLARSQHKAASDACLKALDIGPDNTEAIRLLERVGQAPPDQAGADGQGAPDPSRFKSSAGTAPSRRQLEPDGPPSMTNPFQQLMQELEGEAAERLDDEQPFTALSSGSQTDIPGQEPDFEVPTAPVERPQAGIPTLPARPPTGNPAPAAQLAPPPTARPPAPAGGPEFERSTLPPTPPPAVESPQTPSAPVDDLLAQVPGAAPTPAARLSSPAVSPAPAPAAPPSSPVVSPAPAPAAPPSSPAVPPAPASAAPASSPGSRPASRPTHSAWRRVDAAQAVIDAYRDRIPTDGLDEPPLKVPRLSALLPLVGVLALLAAAVALILALVEPKAPPARQPQTDAPDSPAPTSRAPQPERPPAEAVDGAAPVALPLSDDEDDEGEASPAPPAEDPTDPQPAADQADDGANRAAVDPRPKAINKKKKKPKRIKKRTKRKRRRPRRRRTSR